MARLYNKAKAYCESKGRRLSEEAKLGAGTDGAVWKTGAGTAVKACERPKNYSLELECYQRLARERVTEIHGLAVPELEGYSDELLVIEMTIVQPPYLLDFGKVYLDTPPDYFDDAERLDTWRAMWNELFGDDAPRVQTVLNALTRFGIYYVDPKPANIHLGGE
ncbi:MAG: hypothetical protein AAGA92_14850 [Planctomycetota bacterium]